MVRQGDQLVAPAKTFAASLGEAMLPLRDGRLLITKEKDPPLILEVGPPGAEPLGIGPDRVLGRANPGRCRPVTHHGWRCWRVAARP